ncbi:MAG TPA: hypothetical protein VIW92_02465 [Thermoanaerobaculia bacterium]
MKSRLSLMCALFCLAMLIVGTQVGTAQLLEPQEPQWLVEMYEQGWQKVQEGVLQRSVGGSQVETFTYGEAGLRWTVESLKQQVNSLQQFYNQHPSTELAQAIDHLQNQIGVANARLESGQVEEPSSEQMENCDISYGAHANADSLGGGSQGVTASSNAYFHNNCGFLGNTYALSQVQGAINTVFTIKTQEDPKSGGAWLDSATQLSLGASSQCYSRAYARAWSDGLNISYETLDENYVCPPPPPLPSVWISGTANVYTDYYYPCADVTWTANVSGGTPGYSINWYIGGAYQGSGTQLTKQYCYTNATVTATAQVTDAASQTAQASYTTNIHYTNNYNPCADNPYSCECDPSYCNNCGGGLRPYEICPYQVDQR